MPKMHCVLVTLEYPNDKLERIRKACDADVFLLVDRNDGEGIRKALEKADVAILASDLDERYIHAPHLKWVHCAHAGLNKSAMPELFQSALVVTSSAGRSSPVLAEHAIFFMLSLAYHADEFREAQHRHQWGLPDQDSFRGLYGRTIGIVGLGHTGSDLAIRAKAMGMTVLGYRRHDGKPVEGVDRVYLADQGEGVDDMIPRCDFLVLAVPLSDATWHMIGPKEFSLFKPDACIINMARGPVIDHAALIEALRKHQIAGAGLDTTEPEPLPADSSLWDMPGVLITPHVTPQVPDREGRSLDIILRNIKAWREDKPLENVLKAEDVFSKNR